MVIIMVKMFPKNISDIENNLKELDFEIASLKSLMSRKKAEFLSIETELVGVVEKRKEIEFEYNKYLNGQVKE